MDKVTVKWWVERCRELENKVEDLTLQLQAQTYERADKPNVVAELQFYAAAESENNPPLSQVCIDAVDEIEALKCVNKDLNATIIELIGDINRLEDRIKYGDW